MLAENMRLLRLSFLAQATEIVDGLTRVLLRLESGQSPERADYEELGRGLHTLKGTAGSIGLDEVAVLAHQLEDQLAGVDRAAPLPTAIADAMLEGLDRLMTMVRGSADSGAPADTGVEDRGPPSPRESDLESTQSEERAERGWRVTPRQVRDLMRSIERLRNTRMRLEDRRRRLARAIEDLASSWLERGLDPVARAELGSVLRGLAADREELGDVADAVEEGIKDIWTIPAHTVLERLHRVVRDQCRLTGKHAQLSFVGADVALDRRVVEALRSPFVQLMRNAVDHGIEAPEVRAKAGKHPAGALAIRLEQQGNVLFVEVSDDGAGIDLERVRSVALANGVVTEARLATMSAAEVAGLVFAPGFSTRSDVTSTSGRGVGLDVVLTDVRALDGRIEVATIRGQGTRFSISVPVELGSSAILLVRSGDLRFGVPIASVESVVRVEPSAVHVGRTRMRLSQGERSLPLAGLSALLGLAHPAAPSAVQPALVVQSGDARTAVLVDEIEAETDVMVRPLPEELRNLAAYQGVASVATGEVLLVLRAPWLVSAGNESSRPIAVTRRALVVDDSVTARAIHRAVLEAAGYVVHAVGGAAQALAHLRRGAYDVVVCDVAMPEIDGLELTRRVRAGEADVPVVLVSAHDTDNDRASALDAGADAFLSKRDCASGRLLDEVSRAITRRTSQA